MTPGDYVSICVKDTGHGIPADQLQNVIEPFYTTKDIAKKFQLQTPDLKVLLMTGYADDNIPGYEPGDQKFPLIKKPFDSIALLEKISDIIGPNQN